MSAIIFSIVWLVQFFEKNMLKKYDIKTHAGPIGKIIQIIHKYFNFVLKLKFKISFPAKS